VCGIAAVLHKTGTVYLTQRCRAFGSLADAHISRDILLQQRLQRKKETNMKVMTGVKAILIRNCADVLQMYLLAMQ
jgi:hypothetical protein